MTVVTLYGKPGCCLCDEAKAAIEQVREHRHFILEEVDITLDPALNRDYGERIPVVAVDGDEAFELGVDPAELENRLARVGA
jgi:glutaredoxin